MILLFLCLFGNVYANKLDQCPRLHTEYGWGEVGISQGCQPLLKGGLAYLGRCGLERLCSGDQFASRERGGQRITLICRSLREGGWRHERFEKGKKQEGILGGQARLCPDGRGGGRALRTTGVAPVSLA